jgi:hypothetical protein
MADMVEEIYRLLREEMGRESSLVACPNPARLVSAGRGSHAANLDVADLALHFLRCFRCALRWDQIQRDGCVGWSESLAVARLKPDEFLRLRAEDHARRCRSCRWVLTAVRTLPVLGQPFQPPKILTHLPAVARSDEDQWLQAAVLEADGRPRIENEGFVFENLRVATARVNKGDGLVVSIEVPPGYSHVHLALVADAPGDAVALAPAEVAEGKAEWRVPGVAGEGAVPLSRLAAEVQAIR